MLAELAKKDLDTVRTQEENDALKMKNVDWICQHATLINKLDKLQRDHDKLQHHHRDLQQDYLNIQNQHIQLELDYNHMKRDYSEVMIAHKSLNASMHKSQDTASTEQLEAKW